MRTYLGSAEFAQEGHILVGVHYRPPGSPPGLFDELEGSIARIPTTVPVVLCGDFNAASINWETCTPLVSGQVQSRLCDIVQDHSLHQLVQQGTRGSNILDLVLTNDPSLVEHVEVVENLDGCDHDAVQFDLALCTPRAYQPRRLVYNYEKADFDAFRGYMANIPWECTQMDDCIKVGRSARIYSMQQ